MAEYFSLSSELMKAHSPSSFEQQSFLGASITNFTINCGMGDSSSTLNVELIVDEFNSGDLTGLGYGQDIYHDGIRDRFSPPPVGSPLFFSFGHKKADTKNSFLKTFDDFYNTSNIAKTTNGYYHLNFGGILQSYTKNNSATGGEQYSVSIVDPREILSNAQLILNNYAGSTYGSVNLINLYGFLEHNLINEDGIPGTKFPLIKKLRSNGSFYYEGSDMRYIEIPTIDSATAYLNAQKNMYGQSKFPIDYTQAMYDPRLFQSAVNIGLNPTSLSSFPLTGTGFARIQNGGIPIYRVIQAINGMSGFNGPIPAEYIHAGYSGYVYFRGLKYVVDLSSLPIVDPMQRLDFDQISILDFCLELCDIANHDLMVNLLPIIDICGPFYAFNTSSAVSPSDPPFGGIIKVWSIDRSSPPKFGALQKFIDSVKNPVSTDVGFELSNITSDKFLIGAQTVNQYFFSSEEDRPLPANEYKLEKMFDMQVIPYYGLIDNQAVTIPKGTGPYKQILLDSSTLNANGVGDFYVATEMELRCALVSYEQWSQFLISYNDRYLESVEADDIRDNIQFLQSTQVGGSEYVAIEENYAVTVPRCVWGPKELDVVFDGNLPVVTNFCNPPYGYPLYFKRATQIGIPEAGLVGTVNKSSRVVTDIGKLMSMKPDEQGIVINNIYKSLIESREYGKDFSPIEQELFDIIQTYKDAIDKNLPLPNTHAFSLDSLLKSATAITARSKKQSKSSLRNAKRVYDFIKNIADECLGKKYLVKIPQRVNTSFDYFIHGSGGAVSRRGVNYSPQSILTNNIFHNNTSIESGPYGFMPRAINSTTESTTKSASFIKDMLQEPPTTPPTDKTKNWKGALKFNKNPFTDEFEFNYVPEPNGGFYDFNMEKNVNGGSLAVRQGLIPIDLGKFINENGRLGAYVRFDNSHFLSFDKMSSDSFVQQKKEDGFFSPDVSYNLPNTVGVDYIPSKEDIATNNDNPSVAFVKCTLDDKFYMPPSGSFVEKAVYNKVLVKTIKQKPHKVRDPLAACKEVDSITPLSLSFEPTSTSTSSSYQVYDFEFRTNRKDFNDPEGTTPLTSDQMGLYKPYVELDTRHVYALITLPDRVVPTVTTLMGGLPPTPNILTYMHLLFVDTIKASQDPGGFDSLTGTTAKAFPPDFTSKKYRDEFSLEEIDKDATEAEKKSISNLTFASQKIEFAAPSPVIPSLVALPMLSKEDCYGPWRGIMFHDLNSDKNLDYNADMLVGGKIEFVKDENLAPWNFNGYALMDEHGKSLARFLSTPMICSERGGFTVTDAPSGISIGSIIKHSEPDPANPTAPVTFYGPLVTNISVSISSDGIQTTYQCNSYTPSFGRLEKKRQELIAKITRNQQKLKDEKNALIRKNIGKNQNGLDYNQIYKDMMNISRSASQTAYTPIEAGKSAGNNPLRIVSIQPQNTDSTIVRSDGTRQDVPNSLRSSSSAISTSYENYAETASTMADNPISLFRSHYFSAIQDESSTSVAISMDPSHPAMPSVENESMINMEYGDSVEGATYWS
jgi:hypothetical protein